jgi:hypothetical protein
MNWISIKDELPHTNDDYLVYLPNGHFCIGYWMSGDFWSNGYYTNRLEVTHWAYLEAP